MPDSSTPPSSTTILFLAANPKDTHHLRLDQEVREIEAGLERSKYRDRFELKQRWAVTARDMQRSIVDFSPQIVHFSGHGSGEAGLALEDQAGSGYQLVPTDALAQLFALFAAPNTEVPVECVLLNACYSQVQAEAIAAHVPYVIGMSQAIGDTAAREFAVGFYDALGAGKSIPLAYKFGCTSISLAGIPEHLTPVLITSASHDVAPTSEAPVNFDPPDSSPDSSPDPSPLTPVRLESPEGSVPLGSAFYMERSPIERDCYDAILPAGALIRIKAPRGMGKSSLMQRILARAKEAQHQTASLDMQLAPAEALNTTDAFLQWFCASVSDELGLEERLEQHWKGVLGSKSKCTNYFQRYLLPTLAAPLTLGLDEVDQVFQYPTVAQDFFGLLRSWHEKGRNDPLWQKFRLVIVHSKEVDVSLNINQSPFNVGLPIELPGLTQAQAADLAGRHGLAWNSGELEPLMALVAGHPYLLRKALYEIGRDHCTLEELIQGAATDAGVFGQHLMRHMQDLQANGELEAAMRRVVSVATPVRLEPDQSTKLRSLGLIKLTGNAVEPFCSLYRLYFCDRWGVGQ